MESGGRNLTYGKLRKHMSNNRTIDFSIRLLEWDIYILKHEMGLDRLPTDGEVAQFVANKLSDLLATYCKKNPEALVEHAEVAAAEYIKEVNAPKIERK